MRLTVVLYKHPLRWMLKNKWLAKGKFYQYPTSPPAPVVAKGVEIVDAAKEYLWKKREPLEPFERPDHPLFDPKARPEDHPDYHPDPVYDYHRRLRLTQGLDQACILTKTQPFAGLPDRLSALIGQAEIPDQDELAQRYIMQANVWDPTKDKLPKRFNPQVAGWKFKREIGIRYEKRTRILLSGLLRLCQSTGGIFPDLLTDRVVHRNVYVNAKVNTQGKPVQIHDIMDFLVTSRRPLPAFAGEETVDASTQHTLPSLYPVLPTIDLEKTNIYRDGDHNGFHGNTSPLNPHTIVMRGRQWSASEQNATMLMFLYANASLAARQRFGADVTTLPEPVCVQAVYSNGVNFQFGCFQLNTLDLSSEHGLKNLAWFDNDNFLYQRIEPKRAMLRNTLYQDYDPEVLRKLIAFYVNGADLSIRGWNHPNEGDTEIERTTVNTRSAQNV